MSAPLIAVTGMWSSKVRGLRFDGFAVAAEVLRSIVRAGGEPVPVFPDGVDEIQDRLAGFDGAVIPGGADLQPETYGQGRLPTTSVADYPGQDRYETEVLQACIRLSIPVLAICRGFQLLNVVHGGDLAQDISDSNPEHLDDHHEVDIAGDSRLAGILSRRRIEVSSYHHQAIGRVGRGLRISAQAPDGIVEGLEHETAPVVGVQWHPEDTAASDPSAHALFAWIVGEARKNRNRRIHPEHRQVHPEQDAEAVS